MTENSLALFKDAPTPVASIECALSLLTTLRDHYSVEDEDHGVWLTLGIIGDSIRSAIARMS